MAHLVVTQNTTLDGVVEATGGWFDPQSGAADTSDLLAVVREHMAGQTGFLVGRRTFEEMRSFWPAQTDDTTGVTRHLDEVTKYVVSRTITDPDWQHTRVLAGVEDVRALRDSADGEIGVTGSITLCHALIRAGLVDEYRLFVFPRVLGRGRRLFPDGVDVPLQRVAEQPFRVGVTLLTYRPAA
ncbi:dihydrofolate reductase [Geodermatophilus sabuli]|uniref:Dihydrofolate reductase n=1 Tax=Geodermatophilus sabuli TaxID=1564158 RepID=A0A7K3W9A6_9ACTN|nr:dihydrofolate reductase family protein [Geodermatophilus sabuli]NEK60477.1 dihydrofolate reductase [Geodermatophilus sabuli]